MSVRRRQSSPDPADLTSQPLRLGVPVKLMGAPDIKSNDTRCTAPGFLDTRLHYAARLKVVSRRAARASSGLR
jgi:hypothetical protein